MRVIRVSGTIRKAEEEAIRRAREDIVRAKKEGRTRVVVAKDVEALLDDMMDESEGDTEGEEDVGEIVSRRDAEDDEMSMKKHVEEEEGASDDGG